MKFTQLYIRCNFQFSKASKKGKNSPDVLQCHFNLLGTVFALCQSKAEAQKLNLAYHVYFNPGTKIPVIRNMKRKRSTDMERKEKHKKE